MAGATAVAIGLMAGSFVTQSIAASKKKKAIRKAEEKVNEGINNALEVVRRGRDNANEALLKGDASLGVNEKQRQTRVGGPEITDLIREASLFRR